MLEILEKIRKPSIFILLLILNLRFLFTVVIGEREVILSVLTVLFFFLSIDYSGIRREYLCWILAFVGISIIDFTEFKLNVLTPLILMQCISRFDIRTYLRYNIIILGVTAIVMLLLVGTGTMYIGGELSFIRTRYDFGFTHPNVAAIYYWGLFMSLILFCSISKYKNFLWILLVFILIGAGILYTQTISRSFIIVFVSFVIILCYYTFRSKFTKDYKIGYSRYALYSLPLLFTILTIYFAVNVNKYPALDFLFSRRLSFFNMFLQGLTPMEYITGTSSFKNIVIDSSYLHLLFEAGVLLFIYFIWLYYFAIKNIIKQQNFVVLAIFISFLIYGLMESLLLYSVIIGNNIFWVLLYRYRYEMDEVFNIEKKDGD